MKNLYLKRLVMVFVISCLASNLFSQEADYDDKVYFKFNTGYGFPVSSHNMSFLDIDYHNIYTGSGTRFTGTRTYEQINVSLGKGLDIEGSILYMFNENIGTELGVSFLLGSRSEATHELSNGKIEYTLSSNMVRFNPSVVIASGFEKFNPYAKFGMIIGLGNIIYEKENNILFEEQKMKMKGGVALGLSSGIGVRYDMNQMLSFFGELKMNNLSYAPEEGKMIKYTKNGADRLSDLPTREKEVDFVDSYTENYGGDTPPESEPRKQLKKKFPYGSLAIKLGLMINIEG